MVAPIFAQTFTGQGGIINDYYGLHSPTVFEIQVEDLQNMSSPTFGVESICLHIRHKRTRDLKIELLSPSGTSVWLSNRNSDPRNYGYFETCFEQNGFNGHIIQPNNRFQGIFNPEGRLEFLNQGQDLNGSWFLMVSDLEEGEIGKLLEWSITFSDKPATLESGLCDEIRMYECLKEDYDEGHQFLPDLILSKRLTAQHIEYFSDTCKGSPYRNQLRFAAAMANIGAGPLIVSGLGEWNCDGKPSNGIDPCPNGEYPRQPVYQNVVTMGTDTLEYKRSKGGTMYYDTQPGHNHYHADHWVRYSILKKKWWSKNPKTWKTISASDKVSYCLYDNMICTEENGYCHQNNTIYSKSNLSNFGFGKFNSCDEKMQGISVGGIDYYGKYYEGQSLDIPKDLECGIYYLCIEIDPENYYRELDEDNNLTLFKLRAEKDSNEQLTLKLIE